MHTFIDLLTKFIRICIGIVSHGTYMISFKHGIQKKKQSDLHMLNLPVWQTIAQTPLQPDT